MIMANLCDTQYKITGEKKAVADLWNTLQEMNVNEKNIWLGDLANHYGIDYKAKGFSVRGEIYWAEYEEYYCCPIKLWSDRNMAIFIPYSMKLSCINVL